MAEGQTIEFSAASVAERGGRTLVLRGESTPVGWRLELRLDLDGAESADDGTLSLTTPAGATVTATLEGGRFSPVTDGDGQIAAAQFDLTFVASDDSDAAALPAGTIRVNGTLAGEGAASGGSYTGQGALLTVAFGHDGADD